jgi:cytochrome c-type biogenesis protein
MLGTGPLGWEVSLAAFGAGVASFFSPCVAPLVPGYMGYLAGASVRQAATETAPSPSLRGNSVLPTCLLFVSGFAAAFVALGLLAGSFGALLVAYRPVLETVAGIAMLVMGAFLLNLLPRSWMQALSREWRLPEPARALGGLAPFGLGVVFAAGWTPCIGPVLGTILLYVGASATPGQGALLLALYALGFALPFLAVGLGWSVGLRALGWLKRYGHLVTIVSGVALILVGLLYLTGQVAQISIWAQHIAPSLG